MSTNSAPDRKRRYLLLAAGVAAGGVGLAWQPWRRRASGSAPITDFEPPHEDICVTPPDAGSGDLGHSFAYTAADASNRLAPRAVPEAARCPVCGMYPARYLKWGSQIIYADGATHFFDSPADLMLFLREPARYAKDHTAAIPREEIAALYVTDYGGGQWVPAREAFFVLGSSIKGPMRSPDLPAFARREAAEALVAEHGGAVLDFASVEAEETLSTLRGMVHGGHDHP